MIRTRTTKLSASSRLFFYTVSQLCLITARVAKRAKVMFSQASVILSLNWGGVTLNASWDRSHAHGDGEGGWWSQVNHFPPPTPRQDPSPPDRTHHPLDWTHHPLDSTPPPLHRTPAYLRELRSMGGRCVSYWNASLLWCNIDHPVQRNAGFNHVQIGSWLRHEKSCY